MGVGESRQWSHNTLVGRSWKELGKGSIPVAVLHDENRNTYRVVAMDGQSAVRPVPLRPSPSPYIPYSLPPFPSRCDTLDTLPKFLPRADAPPGMLPLVVPASVFRVCAGSRESTRSLTSPCSFVCLSCVCALVPSHAVGHQLAHPTGHEVHKDFSKGWAILSHRMPTL